MNFLAHGLLVRRAGSADVLVGSALPDLAPLADRRLRLTPARLDWLEWDGATDLVRGCRHHLRVDRAFHHGEPFAAARHAVEPLMRDLEAPLPASMLAHILVEIGIDAEVLRRDPDFAEHDYAAAFDAYDWDGLLGRLRRMSGTDTSRFARLISRFNAGAFLRTYATDEGILDRVNSMCLRVRGEPLTAAARRDLRPAVVAARSHARAHYDALMPWDLEL